MLTPSEIEQLRQHKKMTVPKLAALHKTEAKKS
jgi:DNA-binding transcriptional regulator YiaG